MPMCVENNPFQYAKKMRTKKENPFSTHFCYDFICVVLGNYHVVISYNRRKFLVLVPPKEIG